MKYTKPPLSIDEQLSILQDRGLIIEDIPFARNQLAKIGYFRFVNYLYPLESDKENHFFKPHSSFDKALNLYYFDKELRSLLFSAIQTVEIALRSKITHSVAMKYGAFWFSDIALFTNKSLAEKNLSVVRAEVARSKEDFILNHYKKYDTPDLPPVWKTMEVLSFGTISKIYRTFSDKVLKKGIAHEFGLPQHKYLESWMMSLCLLRNFVAHHMRVWNRNFSVLPQLPEYLDFSWIDSTKDIPPKVYSPLCCLIYLQNQIHPDNLFVKNFKSLLSTYSNIDTHAMGFPDNWQEQPLWN